LRRSELTESDREKVEEGRIEFMASIERIRSA
jgi:hypothetical protein